MERVAALPFIPILDPLLALPFGTYYEYSICRKNMTLNTYSTEPKENYPSKPFTEKFGPLFHNKT